MRRGTGPLSQTVRSFLLLLIVVARFEVVGGEGDGRFCLGVRLRCRLPQLGFLPLFLRVDTADLTVFDVSYLLLLPLGSPNVLPRRGTIQLRRVGLGGEPCLRT